MLKDELEEVGLMKLVDDLKSLNLIWGWPRKQVQMPSQSRVQSVGQSYNWNRRLFLQSNKESSFLQGCGPNQNFSISQENEE